MTFVGAWRRSTSGVAAALAVAAALGCSPATGTIGAVIAQRPDGRLFVREVPEDLAAGKLGIREGDEILLIDGRDVRAMDNKTVHAALSGEVGQSVKLTLIRGEEVLRVTVKRTPARRRKAKPR